MIVYRITGDAIGDNDCGAAYYPTQGQAILALHAYKKERGFHMGNGPEKIVIHTRAELVNRLNEAMGFGCT